jgi:hypothetical protein
VRKFSRKSTIIASSLALVLATSVVAYAYWTNSGAGTGNASTGNNTVTVNQLSTPSGLIPGGPPAPLFGDFDNPNTSSVHVNHVTAEITSVTGGPADPADPACTAADFLLGGNPAFVGTDVAPGPHKGAWSGITLQLQETGLDQDNCKNVAVVIGYSTD